MYSHLFYGQVHRTAAICVRTRMEMNSTQLRHSRILSSTQETSRGETTQETTQEATRETSHLPPVLLE